MGWQFGEEPPYGYMGSKIPWNQLDLQHCVDGCTSFLTNPELAQYRNREATPNFPAWAPSTTYVAGHSVINGGFPFTCVGPFAGISGSTPPTPSSLVDGSVTWALLPPWEDNTPWHSTYQYFGGDPVRVGDLGFQAISEKGDGQPAGVSGTSPPTPSHLFDGGVSWHLIQASWLPNHHYEVDDVVLANGVDTFRATGPTNGTSGTGGGPAFNALYDGGAGGVIWKPYGLGYWGICAEILADATRRIKLLDQIGVDVPARPPNFPTYKRWGGYDAYKISGDPLWFEHATAEWLSL
jgi:hypothetical protein